MESTQEVQKNYVINDSFKGILSLYTKAEIIQELVDLLTNSQKMIIVKRFVKKEQSQENPSQKGEN